MSVGVRYLVDRLRHPRSRADELARLRARFAAQPSRWQASRRAAELAAELAALRVEMHRQLGRIDVCAGCARNHPLPAGRWDGGHCCGGQTLRIFAPLEVAALKLGGVAVRRYRAPRDEHAGCAFRGPSGCSLAAAERPTICLRYVCIELRQTLKDDGRWPPIAALNRQLSRRFADFVRELGADAQDDGMSFSPGGARASSGVPRGS
jgi:hypothetical protein